MANSPRSTRYNVLKPGAPFKVWLAELHVNAADHGLPLLLSEKQINSMVAQIATAAAAKAQVFIPPPIGYRPRPITSRQAKQAALPIAPSDYTDEDAKGDRYLKPQHVTDYMLVEYYEFVDKARRTLLASLSAEIKARLTESWPPYGLPNWDPFDALQQLKTEYDREDQVKLSLIVQDFWKVDIVDDSNTPGTASASSVRNFLHKLQKVHTSLVGTDFSINPRDLYLHVGNVCRKFISLGHITTSCDDAIKSKIYPSTEALFRLLDEYVARYNHLQPTASPATTTAASAIKSHTRDNAESHRGRSRGRGRGGRGRGGRDNRERSHDKSSDNNSANKKEESKKSDNSSSSSTTCMHCGIKGHTKADCRKKARDVKEICTFCDDQGHRADYCPKNGKWGTSYFDKPAKSSSNAPAAKANTTIGDNDEDATHFLEREFFTDRVAACRADPTSLDRTQALKIRELLAPGLEQHLEVPAMPSNRGQTESVTAPVLSLGNLPNIGTLPCIGVDIDNTFVEQLGKQNANTATTTATATASSILESDMREQWTKRQPFDFVVTVNVTRPIHEQLRLTLTKSEICAYLTDGRSQPFLWDGGANVHLVGPAAFHLLTKVRQLEKPVRVRTSGTQYITATHIGQIEASLDIAGTNIKLHNVLFSPDASTNVISVPRLAKSGRDFGINSQGLTIKSGSTDEPIIPYDSNDLWTSILSPIHDQSEPMSAAASSDNNIAGTSTINAVATSLMVWHRRLIHLSLPTLRQVLDTLGIKYTEPTTDELPCLACAAGKGKAPPYSKQAGVHPARSTEPGQTLFADLCGPLPDLGLNNERFFILLGEDNTSSYHVKCLRHKDEATDCVIAYTNHMEAQLSTGEAQYRVKRLIADMGGEFSDQELRRFCDKKGIDLKLASPGASNQNSRAERGIGVFLERARTACIQANLPSKYWTAALTWCVQVSNDLPKKRNNWLTPHEKLLNLKPNISRIHAFGSLCWIRPAHTSEENKTRGNQPAIYLYQTTQGSMVEFLDDQLKPTGRRLIRRDIFGFTESPPSQIVARNVFNAPTAPRESQSAINGNFFSAPTAPAQPTSALPVAQSQPLQQPTQQTTLPLPQPVQGTPAAPALATAQPVATPPPTTHSNANAENKRPATPPTISKAYEQKTAAPPIRNDSANSAPSPAKPASTAAQPSLAASRPQRSTAGFNRHLHTQYETELNKPHAKTHILQYLSDQLAEWQPDTIDVAARAHSTVIDDEKDADGDNAMDFFNHTICTTNSTTPTSYEEASTTEKWRTAATKELTSLQQRGTFEPILESEIQRSRFKPLTAKWIFREKGDGTAKARLVVRGYAQRSGIDFNPSQLSAPVASIYVFRLLLAIAAAYGLTVVSSDYTSAYTNAALPDEIYIHPPPGLIETLYPDLPAGKYLIRLRKALYGLRQSAWLWCETLASSFIANGFNRHTTEPCLYYQITDEGVIIASTHVDDTLAVCSPSLESRTVSTLSSMFESSKPTINPTKFLHWDIQYSGEGIHISAQSFLNKCAQTAEFPLFPCHSPPPIRAEFDPASATPADAATLSHFQSLVGQATYAVYIARPDAAFAASDLASVTQPSAKHIDMARHLFRYLLTTANYGILYTSSSSNDNQLSLLSGASDADHAGDPVTRRSQLGGIIYFNQSPVDWLSRRQPGVPATSAPDAELAAMIPVVSRLDYFRFILSTLHIEVPTIDLRTDSLVNSAILNGPAAAKARHTSIRIAFVRHYVDTGVIVLTFVRSHAQPADGLTKPLPLQPFQRVRQLIPIVPPPGA